MHFDEIEAQRRFALHAHGGRERVRRDVRIAVAVAADPGAHAQERRHPQSFETLFDVGVKARDLAQKGAAIIAQRILDFVAHGQTRMTQQLGLPELRDAGAKLHLVLRALGLAAHMFARGEQFEDRVFGVEQALAAHFRRMRGQHRRNPAARQRLGDLAGADGGLAQTREGRGEARRAGEGAARLGAGALLQRMQIFGDIRKMREIAEGADHGARLFRRQRAQQRVEIPVGFGVPVAAGGDGEPPDRLDALERRGALMFANGVAEQAPEKANVVNEGFVALQGFRIGARRRSGRNELFLRLRFKLHTIATFETFRASGRVQGSYSRLRTPFRRVWRPARFSTVARGF